MINFAFIHYYKENTLMGKMLSFSIKSFHPRNRIISIIGENQNPILNSDLNEVWKFSKENIMFDCISAQLNIVKKYGPTIFLDADMLIIKPINEFINIKLHDMSLTQRSEQTKKRYLNNDSHKHKFPKLINKTFGETMPYNAGIYFCKSPETLKYMLDSFHNMPKEYFQWYGDQIALNELVNNKSFKIKLFKDSEFNFTPKNIDQDICAKYVLHFKGRRRDLFIPFFKKIFGSSNLNSL